MSMSPDALVHTTLGGYVLRELIGRGSFAWVFRGQRPGDPDPVAVKVLTPRYSIDPRADDRFRNEHVVASDLSHPHIVRIHTVGHEDDLTFFVMDLYPESLASRLDATATIAEPLLVSVAVDIARALAFAHDRGIIHRDIKPDNIMLAPDGRAVLTDFGIARLASKSVTAPGSRMTIGTPHYISPEQAQGRTVDGRSDLYSLGVTLYRAATGSLPFRSKDWYELARMHVEDAPQAPRARQPELSRHLDRIILRLLAKHPDDRFESARALLKELRAKSARPRGIGTPGFLRRLLNGRLTGPLRAEQLRRAALVGLVLIAVAVLVLLLSIR